MDKDNIYILLLYKLLRSYREVLILFYISLKYGSLDTAFSLIPIIENYEKKILRIINRKSYLLDILTSSNKSIDSNPYQSLRILISKLLLIQKKIEKIYKKKKLFIDDYSNKTFYDKIDFLIKIFLQEKGL